jgi:hypothetical protein
MMCFAQSEDDGAQPQRSPLDVGERDGVAIAGEPERCNHSLGQLRPASFTAGFRGR